MKALVLILVNLSMLGLLGCDDGKSSSSGRNRFLNTNQVWVTSPRGSNCIFNGNQYIEQFQAGYNRYSTWNYSGGFSPFNAYNQNGQFNNRYRDPYYSTYGGCSDINNLINQQGFLPFQGDYRFGNINSGCPRGSQPVGFGWGVACQPVGFSGSQGRVCNVHTDRHCVCRSLTANIPGTNPAQSGICVN